MYVRAVYSFTAGEPTDLGLSAGDVVRVLPPSGAGADAPAWLHGQNVLSLASGYFPRSHVHVLDEAEVSGLINGPPRGRWSCGGRPRPAPIQPDDYRELNNDSGYVGSPLKGTAGRPIYTHLLQAVYVVTPVYCVHCGDYIWGSGPCGQRCTECSGCFHSPSCARCSPLHPCQRGGTQEAAAARTYSEPVPIHKWTSSNVLEWMASINLINPVEIFKSMNIDGMELLNLDKEKLMAMGIKDSYIQSMLLLGVKRLQAGEGGAAGELRPGHGGHSASDHQLRPASFSALQSCHACGLYLLGTDHQGLACIECGLVVHLRCGGQPGGLPACDASQAGRPPPSPFGAELSTQFQPGRQSGPPLLQHCLAALERRCQLDRHINCFELYETSVSWEELKPLRDAAELDPEGVDLSRFELSHISSLVKKFLAHLPNPVIPVQAYDEMLAIAEGHMESSDGCSPAIDSLVSRLQDHHAATLRLVMRHVGRLCQLQQARGHRQPPAQLLKTLSFVLIRPPFEQITSWPERTSLHTRILELLVMNCDWGGPAVPEWDPPPALPPRPSRDPTPQVPPRRELDLERERPDWYWGNISREEVSEKLNGQPDGTFLVRDSHTASGEYTLCLRKGGNNRLIRIYCRRGRFGFSEPCQFDSVVKLIDHYRRESLRDYNVQLDVRLERPLVESRQYGSNSDADLIDRLRVAHTKHASMEGELDRLEKHRSTLTDRITVQKKAREAYVEVLHMLEEHKNLHLSNRSKAQLHEKEQLQNNWQLLESRVEQVLQCKQQVEQEIHRQTSYARTTENELSGLHQEVRRLLTRRRDLERELRRRGVTQERLEKLQAGEGGEGGDRSGADGPPLSEQEKLWLLEGYDRPGAEAVLRDKPDGTFLIRRRHDRPEMYVLSIRALGQVQHCLIDRSERGYGFSRPYAIHASLRALVDHYAENELGDFNEKLPTRLRFPALAAPPSEYICLPD